MASRAGDRASHLAGLGFDAAVWEIWPNLAAGATVCLANDAVRSSPELLQQWMIRERVTIGFVPTVHAAPMMAMAWPATQRSAFSAYWRRCAAPRLPPVSYPSTSSITTDPPNAPWSPHPPSSNQGHTGRPPIGRPIAGTSVYLLNEDGEQVPDGSTGEIYIGGSGVGRGYRNLPDSTERSFLPDPFCGSASGAHVSHGRSRSATARRRDRISRTPGPANEDPRTTSRTG